MTKRIEHCTIEAAMRRGRIERALAMQSMARRVFRGLRDTTKMVIAIFA